jgi:hypothetical protein
MVQVRAEEALALQGRTASTPASRGIADRAASLGIELEPLEPGAEDLGSPHYFTASLIDPDLAQRAAEELLKCEAVDAAYVKPPDEPPG